MPENVSARGPFFIQACIKSCITVALMFESVVWGEYRGVATCDINVMPHTLWEQFLALLVYICGRIIKQPPRLLIQDYYYYYYHR